MTMPAFVLLLLAFAASPDSVLAPASSAPPTQVIMPHAAVCPGGQTLYEETIEASGAVRLAGLVRLLDGPRAQTVHGFLWPTRFGEAAPGTAPETALLIDGAPLAPDLLGLGDLERLPADVPDLARVTFCPGPYLADGRLWPGGALLLHTRREQGVRGSAFIGNEVGDPGPFRYLAPNRNIDKFGPDYSGAAVWLEKYEATSRAEARFKIRRFYATDPEVLERTATTTGDFPRLRLLSGEARGQFRALGGRHQASVIAGGGNVLPLVPSLGQEAPIRAVWAQAALSAGSAPQLEGLDGFYHIRAAHESTASRNDRFPAALGWSAQTVHGRAELRHKHRDTRHTLGLSATHTRPDAAGAPAPLTLGRLYAERQSEQRGLSRSTALGLTATATLGPSGLGGAALLRASLDLDPAYGAVHTTLTGTLGISHTLPEEAPDLGFWQARGAAGFRTPGVERTVHAPSGRTEARARLDVEHRENGQTFTLSGGATLSRGIRLEDDAFASFVDQLAHGRSLYRTDASGLSAHLGGVLETLPVPLWATYQTARFRLFADARGALAGTDAFRDAWRTAPVFRGGARVSLEPDYHRPSFSIFSSIELRSGTRWPAYASTGRDHTPPLALLDAGLRKTFIGGRLRTSLLFRNLLSAPERYHPLGAELDLRLYARAVLHLL